MRIQNIIMIITTTILTRRSRGSGSGPRFPSAPRLGGRSLAAPKLRLAVLRGVAGISARGGLRRGILYFLVFSGSGL